MITLTAQMRIQGENPLPFTLGVSELGGGALFGTTIDEEVKFNRRNLISLESEVKDRADIDKPSFGIISTGGSLSFKDTSSRFLNYANAGLLTEGIEIKIFVENTLTKESVQVGQYYTTDWDYDNDNRSAYVKIQDDLVRMQGIKTDDWQMLETPDIFLFDLYSFAKQKSIENGYAFEVLSIELENFMKKIKVMYPYLQGSNLWNIWEKISVSCCANLFINNSGKVEMRR